MGVGVVVVRAMNRDLLEAAVILALLVGGVAFLLWVGKALNL